MMQEISIAVYKRVRVCAGEVGVNDNLGRVVSTAVLSGSRSSSSGCNICSAADLLTLNHKCPSDKLKCELY